ncbi:MAG: CAP domain-containing protein [Chloroflexota bacterium]
MKQFDMGDIVAVKGTDGNWTERRVMGTGYGDGTGYKVTGAQGPTDYGNAEEVSAGQVMELEEAKAQGLIQEKAPEPQSVTVDPSDVDAKSLEQEILQETNLARTNPQQFAAKIKDLIKSNYQIKTYSDGRQQLYLTLPGESTQGFNIPSESAQYQNDVEEAITFLENQTSLSALAHSAGLSKSAMDLAKDPNNSEHTGGDGSSAHQRMARYGTGGRGENLGGGNTVFAVVAGFIIDHNVPDRGHREIIFDSAITHLGVGCHYFPKKEWLDDEGYTNTISAFMRAVMNTGENWVDK